ncbi:MAG: 23S rRNA (guanosine(2251)-2'-O)-methyltransferase RlmB [bacterium]|nr:23S rRNA (guanosine(2251)-2'-O)-methyltransferase RlmB [bacterium]
MLVYGRNVAKELLENGKDVKKIFLQDNFDDKKIISLMEKLKISVEIKPKREMDHLCNGLHQGIILDIRDYQYSKLDDVLNKNPNFVVILDHLEDPHNFGAIIRTSEAAGVDAIIIPKDRQVPVNSTVMKTSAGALANMEIVCVSNLVQAINKLKDNGFWVVGTAMENAIDYKDIDYSSKIALIIGNEGKGMSRLVMDSCDYIAKIPMVGKINSLNASVASGIMIYEVVRNRK